MQKISLLSGKQLLSEEVVEECFSIGNDAPIVNKLTDDKIWRMVFQPEESESSEGESEESKHGYVSIDKCIDLTKQLITGLETEFYYRRTNSTNPLRSIEKRRTQSV